MISARTHAPRGMRRTAACISPHERHAAARATPRVKHRGGRCPFSALYRARNISARRSLRNHRAAPLLPQRAGRCRYRRRRYRAYRVWISWISIGSFYERDAVPYWNKVGTRRLICRFCLNLTIMIGCNYAEPPDVLLRRCCYSTDLLRDLGILPNCSDGRRHGLFSMIPVMQIMVEQLFCSPMLAYRPVMLAATCSHISSRSCYCCCPDVIDVVP